MVASSSPAPPACGAVSIDCRSCPVVGEAVWQGADDAIQDDFARACRHLSLKRGALLFREGDGVAFLYVLISGAVVLYRPGPRQRPVAIHLVMPGRTLGFRALAEGGAHRATARLSRDSVLCSIPVKDAERCFAAHRPLERLFLRDLSAELCGMRERLLQMTSLGVHDRLVLMLDKLLRPYGTEVGDGWLIANPLGRADMAALAGMTPETISRCIRNLQEENLAHFSRKSILVPSRRRFLLENERIHQMC